VPRADRVAPLDAARYLVRGHGRWNEDGDVVEERRSRAEIARDDVRDPTPEQRIERDPRRVDWAEVERRDQSVAEATPADDPTTGSTSTPAWGRRSGRSPTAS
jgi:hypothetical protein